MRYTILAVTVALCLAFVSSNPLPQNGLRSETLDRLVMAETDNEEALRSKRTIGILRQLFPDISQDVNPESENRVNEAEAESQNNEVRVQFADETPKEQELTPLIENETEVEDENRDKRGSTGGGSGNILFDIIRQAADGAARAAGTVYRVVAGTQSLGLGLSASRNVGPAPQQAAPAASNSTPTSGAPSTAAPGAGIPPLTVASSGSNSGGEQKPIIGPTDGTPAIPGPITRLLLIGNRGIADIIADLLLDRDEEAQEGASPALVPMDINAEPPLPERNTGTTLAT